MACFRQYMYVRPVCMGAVFYAMFFSGAMAPSGRRAQAAAVHPLRDLWLAHVLRSRCGCPRRAARRTFGAGDFRIPKECPQWTLTACYFWGQALRNCNEFAVISARYDGRLSTCAVSSAPVWWAKVVKLIQHNSSLKAQVFDQSVLRLCW